VGAVCQWFWSTYQTGLPAAPMREGLTYLPPDWAELVPELERQPEDHLVTKQRVGAFIGTHLDDYLRRRGVTQVVLTGISTSAGVESSARSAYDLGYNVTLVVDAMTDRDPDAHRYCVEKVFPRIGETGTTSDVLKLLNFG
jgi:nicotinamidase-related amidase